MARADSLTTFKSSFQVVVHALETLEQDGDTKAGQHLAGILRFEFIIALVAAQHILGTMVGLTEILQKTDMDLLEAVQETKVVLQVFQSERDDATEWDALYQEAVGIAAEHGIPPSVPRRVGRQQNRANHPNDDPSGCWRVSMYYVFLDHLMREISDRVLKHEDRFLAQLLIPAEVSVLTSQQEDQLFETLGADKVQRWKVRWTLVDQENRPKNLLTTINSRGIIAYPNIAAVLIVLLTMPATSASCERSFSSMRRIKTYLRSTMTGDRLSALAVMHIHRDFCIDVDKVLDKFASAKDRNMQFM